MGIKITCHGYNNGFNDPMYNACGKAFYTGACHTRQNMVLLFGRTGGRNDLASLYICLHLAEYDDIVEGIHQQLHQFLLLSLGDRLDSM